MKTFKNFIQEKNQQQNEKHIKTLDVKKFVSKIYREHGDIMRKLKDA